MATRKPKAAPEPVDLIIETPPSGELMVLDASAPNAISVPALPASKRAELAMNSDSLRKSLKKLVAKTTDIKEIKNKDGRQQVHAAYMVLKNTRTDLKKDAKSKREDAAAYQSAVIVVENELVGITTPEEDRLLKLRDDWDERERIENERIAREEAEKQQRISTQLSDFRDRETYVMRMCRTAADTQSEYDRLNALEVTEEFFDLMYPQALEVKRTVLEAIDVILQARIATEAADAKKAEEAEEARKQLEIDQENMRKAMQAQREKKQREEAERVRIEAVRAKITAMQMKPLSFMGKPAADVQAAIEELSAFEPDELFAELADEAKATATQAVAMLTAIHAQAVLADQAAAIVAAKALQDAADAEAQAARDAEERTAVAAAEAALEAAATASEVHVAIEDVPEIEYPPLGEEAPTEAEASTEIVAEVVAEVETDPDFREVADEVASNDETAVVIEIAPYTATEQAFANALRALFRTHGAKGIKDIVRDELYALEQVAA